MSVTDGLLPEEYQAVVAPAMQAAAELAAARGDPYLYNDLACMLALMAMIRDLCDLYQDKWGALGQLSTPAQFTAAPLAGCVMVLSEYEIELESIQSMSDALEGAYIKLSADNIFGPERVYIQKAWDARVAREFDKANAFMRQAAAATANAIDGWEKNRAVSSAN
ncbi:MAG: hypothetical protein ACI915_004172 [Gammaproteobacteria bacterium]|jgi:hypothetical protein